MKLYLSSDGFLTDEQFQELVGKPHEATKVGLVMNAAEWRTPPEWQVRYDECRKMLESHRLNVTLLDLKDYYDKPDELVATLKSFDLLWVRGGNSFLLRFIMQKSGFDKAIRVALTDGLIYAGESAGAIVMGPTLKGIELMDAPRYAPEVVWDGIGIVPTMIVPHYNNHKDVGDQITEMHEAASFKVACLKDGEALMVNGDKTEIVETVNAT